MDIKKLLFGEDLHKNRKVQNSEHVISSAQQLGYTYEKIAYLCGVSKTMISNWGNPNNKSKPTYIQIEPLLNDAGAGLFTIEYEELSPAAIPLKRGGIIEWLPIIVITSVLLGFIWLIDGKPCYENWSHCKELRWYEMPGYGNRQLKQEYQEFKEYRLINNQNNETYKNANN